MQSFTLDALSPEVRKAVTFEDEHWVYFGIGVGWQPDRCSRCLRLVKQYRAPNRYCINCWKLEIFFSNCTDVKAVKEYLLRESIKDPALHGKWLKKKIKIPKELLTSVPEEAHPDDGVEEDGVILIYTKSIKERDERIRKLLKELRDGGLYKKRSISYRRGCVDYDLIIGNWKTWYDLNKDYPT
ncbi:MAG: hypothetical protein QXE96_02085 [Candidatus Caldarchaeum sp.]|jgi:hypothetical protein